MRYAILFIAILLAACNGSSTDVSADASVTAQLQAFQTEINALKSQVNSITIIGHAAGQAVIVSGVRTWRSYGIDAIGRAVSFGTCANMGTLTARGGQDSPNPFASESLGFVTCTHYSYRVSSLTGILDVPPFAVWDGPNCTGNMFILTAIPGDGFNPQITASGAVFSSPTDKNNYYLPAGQTATPVSYQSAINTGPGSAGCSSDIETQSAIQALPNDPNVTGVPNVPIPTPFNLGPP